MTRIFLVRHCEAEGNLTRSFQGGTNLDITELGAKQLELLKDRFKSEKIDTIYTSPLIRAQKTAFAIKGERNMDVKIDSELREIHGGVIEGKSYAEIFGNDPVMADIWDNHPKDFAPENGEKMTDAYDRIYNAIEKIAVENDGKTVAVASHGGVIRCFMARLIFGTIDRLQDVPWAENTSVALITYENGKFDIVYKNDRTHVPDEFLPKRNRLATVATGKNTDK